MTFTYEGDPSSSDLEMVRFLLGDTTSASALFQDEEIEAILGMGHSTYETAAICAETLGAKFSNTVSWSADGLSVSEGDKATKYFALADRLRLLEKKNSKPILWFSPDNDQQPLALRSGIHDNLRSEDVSNESDLTPGTP